MGACGWLLGVFGFELGEQLLQAGPGRRASDAASGGWPRLRLRCPGAQAVRTGRGAARRRAFQAA
ncbi:hypothetical protein [Streptacidiphilus sp. MAP12-16]|uniref:hypothetical protein n=1 Tax=Streptacidiphilus sp. MAP12-16 TaxID=3156300 RepID=UPI003519948C